MQKRWFVQTCIDVDDLPECTEELVSKYKAGDTELRETIVLSNIRLVLALASRFTSRFPSREDDFVSAALYHLIVAVDKFPSVATDDNIAAYINSTVTHELRRCAADNLINIPRTSLFRKIKKGEALDNACILLSSELGHSTQDDALSLVDEEDLIRTLFERKDRHILRLRMQGHTNEEIGNMLNLSTAFISARTRFIQETLKNVLRLS